MFKYLAGLVLAFSFISEVSAATWCSFVKNNTAEALNFFDRDTVIKQDDKVTVWIKMVFDPNSPHGDGGGNYAIAKKEIYSCTKRTMQILTAVDYDKMGKFVVTWTGPFEVQNTHSLPPFPAPGSIGEGLLKTVCTPDFPNNTSGDLYFPVPGNNIFQYTANYYKRQRTNLPWTTSYDPAPK